jgi:hypothetical protein
MSALPSIGISPRQSNEWGTAARHLGDLLDTLIAIRMDVGHSANGIAASPALGPEQMRGVRALLDSAIASTKEMFDSAHFSSDSGVASPSPRPAAQLLIDRMVAIADGGLGHQGDQRLRVPKQKVHRWTETPELSL